MQSLNAYRIVVVHWLKAESLGFGNNNKWAQFHWNERKIERERTIKTNIAQCAKYIQHECVKWNFRSLNRNDSGKIENQSGYFTAAAAATAADAVTVATVYFESWLQFFVCYFANNQTFQRNKTHSKSLELSKLLCTFFCRKLHGKRELVIVLCVAVVAAAAAAVHSPQMAARNMH